MDCGAIPWIQSEINTISSPVSSPLPWDYTIPGSSKRVKCLPFHPKKNLPKGRNFTYLEDPGMLYALLPHFCLKGASNVYMNHITLHFYKSWRWYIKRDFSDNGCCNTTLGTKTLNLYQSGYEGLLIYFHPLLMRSRDFLKEVKLTKRT